MNQKASPNRLLQESSPYLNQHAYNPVDWYPWGIEALKRAKKENKPIFLSIGYSACHWCHVMERESFENEEIAKILNENFINIKVDREERPDLDQVYMKAVQVMTRHGGWPMSVFLTPDTEPFYGGTYFPPDDRFGMPGFRKILLGVASAWKERQQELVKSAKELTKALTEMAQLNAPQSGSELSLSLIEEGVTAFEQAFDPEYGGFGNAPKFFHTMSLRVCLRHWSRCKQPPSLQIAQKTLYALSMGGIRDHLAGGFHRYSTDTFWLVPHFEKMLYDNALLATTFLEAYQATKQADFLATAIDTLEYVLSEMTDAEGGFYSTQDADSEGEEGKYFVWTLEEIRNVLGASDARLFCHVYGVTEKGNWEGKNILRLKKPFSEYAKELKIDLPQLMDRLESCRKELKKERARRIAPMRDEKILTSWNGLMLEAMALGYQVTREEKYLKAAQENAKFLKEKLWVKGSLLHSYKDGNGKIAAFLDDYAFLANGLLSLYSCDFDPQWVDWAGSLIDEMETSFWEKKTQTFSYTSKHQEKLLTPTQEIHDGATPSATACAVTAFIRLGHATGELHYLKTAESTLKAHASLMKEIPQAAGQFLIALERLLGEPKEFVFAPAKSLEEIQPYLATLWTTFLPNATILTTDPRKKANQPIFKDKKPLDQKTTLYICQNFTCQEPLVGDQAIKKSLGRLFLENK